MRPRTLPFVLASSLAAASLPAQFDFSFEKRTAGRLGTSLDLEISAAPPSSLVLIVPSGNAGPTPLSLLEPTDPRVMAVGIDLLSVLQFTVTSPTGGAVYSLPLPNDPTLHAAVLHWQPVVLSFGATLFGQLGNNVVTQVGLTATAANAPATLVSARAFSASLVDADNNAGASDVLVFGGGAGTLTAATGLATSELFDFRRMRMTPGPTMSFARALHLAVPLTDNRVLVIGGADATGAVLASCELYDPATNTFSPTGSMATPRILHAACRLADGRVMVAGGTSTLQPDVLAAIGGTLSSVEIYNPATGTWSGGAALGGRRLAPALTRLPNGQIMVSGGIEVGFFFGVPVSAVSTTAVQRWNPTTGTWTSGPNMGTGRAGHHYNQVTLQDNRVLFTGGVQVTSLLAAQNASPIAAAEAYNPATNSWVSHPMPNARALHSATRLSDGRVVVCGGAQGTLSTPVSIDLVDVFSPTTNAWSAAPSLTSPRASHASALLPDGTLVLFGGQGASTSVTSIETLRF
jgi:hypothetical protein